MPNPTTVREQRLRKTKAQLIDEIDSFEQRVAALEVGREEALREHEQLMETVLDHMPMPVFLRDLDGKFILINSCYEDIHQVTKDGVRGRMLHEVFPMDVADDFQTLDPEIIKERRVLEREETHQLPDGKHILAAVKFPIFDPSGEVIAVGGVDVDVTERKRAEEALRERETLFRTFIDNTPAQIYMKDREGRHVLVNRRVEETIGRPRSDIIGKTSADIYPAELARKYDEHDKHVLATGEADAREIDITVADGTATPHLIVKFPVLDADGNTSGVGSYATDITDRKRAEEALREHEQLMETVLDHMPTPVFLRDLDGKFMLINSCYEDIHQVTKDGVRGRMLHEVFPMDVADDFQTLDPEIIKERRVLEREETHQLPDGKHILAAVKFPIFDPSGEVIAVGGVDVDVTERKRAEEALIKAKQRSEEASKLVAEKNRMLESLSNQLAKYLSPQVYASIFSGEQSVEIASKRKKLTVFFSDIADFTGTTDSLESEELTNLLNHYLTEMSKIALDHGATIDKYVGDAIIAFFGDPETRGVKEDARTCVNMAIAMQRRMQELQSEWLDMGLERPFQVRIGINTGFCTVGNFGSADRMDYTIIGNEVNLAARLESHAEVGGILMAHETHALVKDTVLAEEGDTLTVKGFAKPVRTYSVVGLYDDLAGQGRIIRKDENGLTLIIDRNKLTKKSKARAIKAVEDVFSQLKS